MPVLLLSVIAALLACGCETYRIATIPTDQIGGLNLNIAMKDGRLTIISVQEGSPAFRAGLRPGDVITKINDEWMMRKSFTAASMKICGRAGTEVRLRTVRPSTREVMECTLIREDLAHLQAHTAASAPGQNSSAGSSAQPAATSLPPPADTAQPF
jgi:C-terminal processing protease CtpA/Prc